KAKSDTVSHFANPSATVLYRLAEGTFDEREEAAILAEARKRRVDEDAMWAICEKLAPPDEDDDDDHDHGGDDHHDDGGDEAAAEGEEIAAIFDNPPTPPAGSSENLAPTDFALRDFDQAIGVLKRLKTKSAAQFASSTHSADDLEAVESFLRAVKKAQAVAAS